MKGMQKTKKTDVIVLGVGGMGSSACYHLAKKGLNVLGLEQFSIPHDKGSSHGETRMIRKAYFEHPNYVPLLRRAYQLWDELEEETGQKLFNRCGMILYADESSEVYKGTFRSSEEHQLPLEKMSAAEAMKKWPAYKPFEHHSVLFEPAAGFLYSEKIISAYVSLARENGAVIRENQEVVDFFPAGEGVAVQTKAEIFYADKLVITAGAWTISVLKELNIPFQLLRKNLSWHTAGKEHSAENGTPAAFFDLGENMFYMFPSVNVKGVKIGKHSGGEPINRPEEKQIKTPDRSFLQPIESFIDTHLPHASKKYNDFVSCIYTNTPDQNFLIDRHPKHTHIVFASGFSGHGFKFASVIGEILADLTTEEESELLTDFLRLRRFNG
jgi:sarcosine oxidase